MSDAAIELHQVGKSFDGGRAWPVQDVSLSIARGEFLVLLGESGCGKTTTLKMINRLCEPARGCVRVEGRDIMSVDPPTLRRGMGYVIQGVGLFPHVTIADNIATVPRLLGWDAERIGARVNELLELVHLPAQVYRDRLPRQLSGGQRQRVGLARALAAQPGIMLMDEPFGALDPLTRDDLQREYQQLHQQLKLTTIMVTHDMTEALLLADRIAVMAQGRVVQVAAPAQMLKAPTDKLVRQLMETPKRQAQRLEAMLASAEG